jgi:hypothetical protein
MVNPLVVVDGGREGWECYETEEAVKVVGGGRVLVNISDVPCLHSLPNMVTSH